MTTKEAIKEIVLKNSGGVKIVQLIVDIVSMYHERGISDFDIDSYDHDRMMNYLYRTIDELGFKVLKYSYPMVGDIGIEGNLVREKEFVYIP